MIRDDFITEARHNASGWARNLLSIPANHWIILDTETTGLDENAEVIQIGVTDGAGRVLMDNVVCKPRYPSGYCQRHPSCRSESLLRSHRDRWSRYPG